MTFIQPHQARWGVEPICRVLEIAPSSSDAAVQCPPSVRHRGPWCGLGDVDYATLEYVDWFSQRRLHGEICMLPPAEFEARYDAKQ